MVVEDRVDDQGRGCWAATNESEEGAEIAGGDEAGHEQPRHAGLEVLVKGGEAVCGINATQQRLQIVDVCQIGW